MSIRLGGNENEQDRLLEPTDWQQHDLAKFLGRFLFLFSALGRIEGTPLNVRSNMFPLSSTSQLQRILDAIRAVKYRTTAR